MLCDLGELLNVEPRHLIGEGVPPLEILQHLESIITVVIAPENGQELVEAGDLLGGLEAALELGEHVPPFELVVLDGDLGEFEDLEGVLVAQPDEVEVAELAFQEPPEDHRLCLLIDALDFLAFHQQAVQTLHLGLADVLRLLDLVEGLQDLFVQSGDYLLLSSRERLAVRNHVVLLHLKLIFICLCESLKKF